jgi:nucleoside-diphosphate-sugar epimerase
MPNSIVADDLKRIVDAPLPFDELDGATVLVTGANGFLPAYLVETLLFRNDQGRGKPTTVLALVRNAAKAQFRFAEYLVRSDFKLVVQDVCDPLHIDGPVEFVIHAASQASPKFYGVDPVGTLSANCLGTYQILEFARAKQSRSVLYFSSAEIYGAVDAHENPIKETTFAPQDPLAPRACYAESKRLGETMCASWSRQFGVPVKIVRPFHTYGPGMAVDDGRVFSDFVADVVAGRNIVMQSDGSALRAYCYLADATLGYLTVLLKGENAAAYNVGNPHCEVSVLDLAKLIVGLFPEAGLRVAQAPAKAGQVASQVSRYLPDTSKLEALGWRPTTSLEAGFRRTVLSYQTGNNREDVRRAA